MEYLVITEQQNKNRIIKKISNQPTIEAIKVISYQEFLKKYFFDYTEETIYFLSETYQVTKEIAEIYLKNLYFIEKKNTNSKIDFLYQLKEQLKNKELIFYNPLWKEKLKHQTLVFYHLSQNNNFYKKIIQECQKYTKIQEINYEIKKNNYFIKEYQNLEEEVIGVLSDICTLIKQKIDPNKIFITNLNSDYYKYFEIYSNIFHLPISLKNEKSYLSNQIIIEFIKKYDNGLQKTINELKEKYKTSEEQEIINEIINICNQYSFINLESKKKKYIFEDLKKVKKRKKNRLISIQEIDFITEDIDSNAYLFILGAYEGNFPVYEKDEQYLSDLEKKILNLNTTDEENDRKKEVYLKKISNIENVSLSYPKKNGKLELYLSSILEDQDIQIEKSENEIFSHSNLYNTLILAQKLDTLKKYGTEEKYLFELLSTYNKLPYNNYQNEYKTFPVPIGPQKLSYTSLNTYFHCAFRFYLEYILKINNFEETFDIKIGKLFHQILCESYEKNFDLEKSWQKNIATFEWKSIKENFFLKKLKKDLIRILETIKEQEENKEFNVLTEESINYELSNDNFLTGIIDKIYYKKEQDKTLVSIIDYKTGNPCLNLDNLYYGLNMQLPIYLLLLKKYPFTNLEIVGFYLQKILPIIPERDKIHTEEELKIRNLKLQGYSTDKESILKVFDPTYENSKLIKSLKMSSKGFYSYSKVLSDQQMQKIEEITKQNIRFALQEMEKANFTINPKRIGGKLIGCDYCPYQGVCYRKEKDIQNEKEVKLIDIIGGNEDANMDKRTE